MRQSIQRRSVLAALLACTAGRASRAAPPDLPLRFIVPAPAGGSSDLVARTVGDALHRVAGWRVLVDNRPGGGGAIATDALFAAPPDGRTLLLTPHSLVTELPYSITPRYDPFADLLPLAELATTALVLVADARLPVRDLQDLVAYGKGRPGTLAYASYGAGTASHIRGLQFSRAAGIDAQHIGYRGSPPALQDLLGGRVAFMFDGLATSLPHIRANRLRALAVTGTQRVEALPGVPTCAELGLAELTLSMTTSVFTARNFPAGAAQPIETAIGQALQAPELRDTFRTAGLEVPARRRPAEISRALRRESEGNGELLRAIGFVPGR